MSASHNSSLDSGHKSHYPNAYFIVRHKLPIRIMHWLNVLCFIVLLMSGLNIFNAHPALNLGKSSYNSHAPILEVKTLQTNTGELLGRTNILGYEFNTTGFLGASTDASGRISQRGFPTWMTIPSSQWLSKARHWHFFFAWLFVINGICYITYSLVTKHVQRDLLTTKSDRASIWQSIKDHARFKHASGEAAIPYNVLQKIAYLSVIFILLPLVILMGMAMSPFLDSLIPGWVDLFGGRQSARTIHFIVAWLLVAFVFIHVFEVMITGVWNNLRSMITGQYKIDTSHKEGE
jgi:thiosulfate reductase cytochrome b subunit